MDKELVTQGLLDKVSAVASESTSAEIGYERRTSILTFGVIV